MILINFSHPLSSVQIAQTEALAGQPVQQIIDIPVQFDNAQPFLPQLDKLMSRLPFTPAQLQNEPFLVNLPSLNFIAALLLAELHGRMGYFPSVLRLCPSQGSLPPVFEVAEILNLNQVRETSRKCRFQTE